MFSKNFWFIVSANLLMALKKTLKKHKAVIQINECNLWQSMPTGGSTFGTENPGSSTQEHSNLSSGTGFTVAPIKIITHFSKSFSTSTGKVRQ